MIASAHVLNRVGRNAALPERVRTYQDFAEREIRLPSGKHAGNMYRADVMPFMVDVFAEFDRGRFTDFMASGPVQGGKTLHFLVIPANFHLFEIVEPCILGAPTVDLAKSTWKERMLPAIEQTRYRDFLPRKGAGSKSGTPDSIKFRNGAGLRFMGAGGKDSQRSSHTARVIFATEVDKMAVAGASSSEADPITQLKARSRNFGSLARFYGECTMSTPDGRIYQEVVKLGTDSRVVLPCKYCGEWIWPERGGLVGWQEAEDQLEAESSARFQCPKCKGLWTEEDRRAALRNPRIVARGQTVRKDGIIEGPMPRTRTFGFRWSAMASPFTTIPELAAREWRALQSTDQGQEKAIVQFDWAEPWQDKLEDLTRPDVETVIGKISSWPKKVIPPNTVKLTLGVDAGSYVIWYLLMAWFKDGRGHIVDWDGITVHNPDGVKNPAHVLAALRNLRDTIVKPGWGARGEDHPDGPAPGRQPEKILVDCGYEEEIVHAFVLESGEPRWLAAKGFGSNKDKGWMMPRAQKPSDTKVVAQEWTAVRLPAGVRLIAHHADHWKSRIHDGLHAAHGAPGSITIPAGSTRDRDLRFLARQLCAEQRQMKAVAGHDARVVWVQTHSQNHWLDCAGEAACGAAIEGIRVAVPKMTAAPRIPRGRPTDAQLDPARLHRIRTKY